MDECMLISNKEYMDMLDLIDAQRMLIQKYKNYIELLESIKQKKVIMK